MFRFNMRKSRHRADAMGIRKMLVQVRDHPKDREDEEKSPLRQGNRNERFLASNIKKSSPVSILELNCCDTSETEETVLHVDSSLSQNSDGEVEPTTITTTARIIVVNDDSSSDRYDSSDQDDDTLFLGDIYESNTFDCKKGGKYQLETSNPLADAVECAPKFPKQSHQHIKNIDDPIVALALQATRKILAMHSHIDLDTAALLKRCTREKQHTEPFYMKLDQMGNVFVDQGQPEQAIEKYILALHLKRKSLRLHKQKATHRLHVLASIATSINNVAFLQHNQGRINADETLDSYMIALEIKSKVLGVDHLSVGKTLNNIGSIHYLRQDFQMAVETYEKARDILQLHLGCHHLDVCTVTANLGDVHASMKQWSCAVEEYRKALDLRWPFFGPSDPKVIRLMEQVAELEMYMNQLDAEKDDDDQSDTASHRDRFYGPIVKDVRKLHKEVQRDIDHLDLLASQLPLEMIKDKIAVFQEIREMMENGSEDDIHDKQPDVELYETPKIDGLDPTQTMSDICPVLVDAKKIESSAVARESEMYSFSTPTSIKKQGVQPRRDSCRTPTSKSPLHLTPEERQVALVSVKEKLAKLRSKRESRTLIWSASPSPTKYSSVE
jgi:tetratricopeptide (TPR) repeat protein